MEMERETGKYRYNNSSRPFGLECLLEQRQLILAASELFEELETGSSQLHEQRD